MTSETLFGYSKINFPTDPSDPAKLTRGASTFPLTGYYNNPETPAIVSWGNSVPNLGDIGHDYHPTMVAVKATPSVQENLTKVIKSHTTKFGFYFEHLYNTQDNWGQYMGALSYNQWGTASGNNYADMLMGIGQAGYFEQALPPPSELAQNIYAFYAQDDWKLTRRISVQYGMRFEHYAKPYSPGMAWPYSTRPSTPSEQRTPASRGMELTHTRRCRAPTAGISFTRLASALRSTFSVPGGQSFEVDGVNTGPMTRCKAILMSARRRPLLAPCPSLADKMIPIVTPGRTLTITRLPIARLLPALRRSCLAKPLTLPTQVSA